MELRLCACEVFPSAANDTKRATVGSTEQWNLILACEPSFRRQNSVAREIAELNIGKAKVNVANFSQEYIDLNNGTTIACMEKSVDVSDSFVVG